MWGTSYIFVGSAHKGRPDPGRPEGSVFVQGVGQMEKIENEEKERNDLAGAIQAGHSVDEYLKVLEEQYRKPPTYDRKLYDDGAAKYKLKQKVFQSEKPVKDSYTNQELRLTKKEAKMEFNTNWKKHLAEADHIHPIHKVYEEYKTDPWVSNDDIRQAVNEESNLEVVSREYNNAKRDRTNKEFANDTDYRKGKTKFTKNGKQKAIENGEKAKVAIEKDLAIRKIKNMGKAFCEGGKASAISAAEMTLVISGVDNILAVIKGEKSPGEALKCVGKDVARSAVPAYALGGGMKVVTHTLASVDSPFIKSLVKAGAPGKIVSVVMATGGTLSRYFQGEISTGQCLKELGNTGCNLVWNGYAMMAGQVLIPIPFVGTAVGALVGGAIYSSFAGELMQAAENARMAEEEYERVRLETAEVIHRLRQERADFEAAAKKLFAERAIQIQKGYDRYLEASLTGDFDQIARGLNEIAGAFGKDIGIHSMAELDALMKDDSADFIL